MTAAGCHWDGKGRAAAWAVRMVGRVSGSGFYDSDNGESGLKSEFSYCTVDTCVGNN